MNRMASVAAMALVWTLRGQDPSVEAALKQTQKLQASLQAQYRAHVTQGKDPRAFKPDFAPAMKALDEALSKDPKGEARDALMICRLSFARMGAFQRPELNALALKVRQDVPGRSRGWGVDPELLPMIGTAAMQEEALASNPEPRVRAQILFSKGEDLLRRRQELGVKAVLARMESEFPKESATAALKKAYEDAAPTLPGRPCPPFKLSSLEDGKVKYSLADFRGKYVLLDFWASWCGPCRREMPELHQAWERFKGPKFEMLSLSLDQSSGDIHQFRRGLGQAMPWKHAFLSGGFEHELVVALGIQSIPRPVLLDPEGKVVAAGNELRGSDLLTTLARVLPK